MAEVTRVPIQPIAKGSLIKLWLGVIVAVLAGAGLAWAAVPKGVSVDVVEAGTGPLPQVGDVVFVKYTGKLTDGTVFDESQPLPLPPGLLPDGSPFLLEEGQVVDGFFEGLQQMQKGGKYTLFIPSDKGYGDGGPPSIPPGSDLIFEVEMVDFMSREDAERKFQAVQQMMQMQMQQQQGEGAAGGPPQQ